MILIGVTVSPLVIVNKPEVHPRLKVGPGQRLLGLFPHQNKRLDERAGGPVVTVAERLEQVVLNTFDLL